MKFTTIKTQSGLIPSDPESEERYKKIKLGSVVEHDIKIYRNPGFHRKMFALLNLAFENWIPGEIDSKHGVPKKNFDQFRKDLIILAGYYETIIRLDGSVRIEAKSISFASMKQEEFEKLYSSVLDVILERVYIGRDAEEVEALAKKTLEFA
jgi:hypothetical protein